MAPFFTRSANTGWEEGYTASENSSQPQSPPFKAWAASMFGVVAACAAGDDSLLYLQSAVSGDLVHEGEGSSSACYLLGLFLNAVKDVL